MSRASRRSARPNACPRATRRRSWAERCRKSTNGSAAPHATQNLKRPDARAASAITLSAHLRSHYTVGACGSADAMQSSRLRGRKIMAIDVTDRARRAPETAPEVFLGAGEHRYRVVEKWAKL